MISWQYFEKVEMRTGTITSVEDFPEAKNPSYKLTINFGSFGVKKSSAQVTKLYKKEELVNKQVVAVTNFPPKQIANFVSEVLVLGVILDNKDVVLLTPDKAVPNGKRIA
ncbi:Methionine--tRNA ligase [Candidatus Tiddalikarchaeum anstoanum]|nr:Methionine--tRNA ligase [Candidatus Tiddalikarchaeum anstoanum]